MAIEPGVWPGVKTIVTVASPNVRVYPSVMETSRVGSSLFLRCADASDAGGRAIRSQYVAALAEVGKRAPRASPERNYEAFIDISDKLNDACANCHKVYRGKGGTEGSGAARCQ